MKPSSYDEDGAFPSQRERARTLGGGLHLTRRRRASVHAVRGVHPHPHLHDPMRQLGHGSFSRATYYLSKDDKVARLVEYYGAHGRWPAMEYKDAYSGVELGLFLDLIKQRHVSLTGAQRAVFITMDPRIFDDFPAEYPGLVYDDVQASLEEDVLSFDHEAAPDVVDVSATPYVASDPFVPDVLVANHTPISSTPPPVAAPSPSLVQKLADMVSYRSASIPEREEDHVEVEDEMVNDTESGMTLEDIIIANATQENKTSSSSPVAAASLVQKLVGLVSYRPSSTPEGEEDRVEVEDNMINCTESQMELEGTVIVDASQENQTAEGNTSVSGTSPPSGATSFVKKLVRLVRYRPARIPKREEVKDESQMELEDTIIVNAIQENQTAEAWQTIDHIERAAIVDMPANMSEPQMKTSTEWVLNTLEAFVKSKIDTTRPLGASGTAFAALCLIIAVAAATGMATSSKIDEDAKDEEPAEDETIETVDTEEDIEDEVDEDELGRGGVDGHEGHHTQEEGFVAEDVIPTLNVSEDAVKGMGITEIQNVVLDEVMEAIAVVEDEPMEVPSHTAEEPSETLAVMAEVEDDMATDIGLAATPEKLEADLTMGEDVENGESSMAEVASDLEAEAATQESNSSSFAGKVVEPDIVTAEAEAAEPGAVLDRDDTPAAILPSENDAADSHVIHTEVEAAEHDLILEGVDQPAAPQLPEVETDSVDAKTSVASQPVTESQTVMEDANADSENITSDKQSSPSRASMSAHVAGAVKSVKSVAFKSMRSAMRGTAAALSSAFTHHGPHSMSNDEKVARLVAYHQTHKHWPLRSYKDRETGAALGAFWNSVIRKEETLTEEHVAMLLARDPNAFQLKSPLSKSSKGAKRTTKLKAKQVADALPADTVVTRSTPRSTCGKVHVPRDEKIARLLAFYKAHGVWPSIDYRDAETGAPLGAFLAGVIDRSIKLTDAQRGALRAVDPNIFYSANAGRHAG